MLYEIMLSLMVGLPASIVAQILFTAAAANVISPLILIAGLGIASVVGFCVQIGYMGDEKSALIAVAMAIGIGLGFVGGL